MKKSTIWLVIGFCALLLFSSIGCCMMMASTVENTQTHVSAAAASDVNLERLTKAFEAHATSGKTDLSGFQAEVNDKSKGIYTGSEPVKVSMLTSGAVVGYVDKTTNGTFDPSGDKKVFELNIEEKQKRVVASDRHNNHYRHSPGSSFFTGLLIGNMLSGHRRHYRGGYYTPPNSARYRKSGYYNRMNSSRSRSGTVGSGSRSTRSGSRPSSSSSRSGSRSGGFGSGK